MREALRGIEGRRASRRREADVGERARRGPASVARHRWWSACCSSGVGAVRRVSRHQAVSAAEPAPSGASSPATATGIWEAAWVTGHERPGRAHRRRRCSASTMALSAPAASASSSEMLHAAGGRRQRHADHRPGADLQQHVRLDQRHPAALVVTIVVFFPIFRTCAGPAPGRPDPPELMRCYARSPWRRAARVRVPERAALPLHRPQAGGVAGVIAAVVAEYFGGPQNGLGSRITSAAASSRTRRAWAYVLGAVRARPGLLPGRGARERLAMPWQRPRQQAGLSPEGGTAPPQATGPHRNQRERHATITEFLVGSWPSDWPLGSSPPRAA